MKITDVITHQLSVKVDQPFTSSRGWVYTTRGALVVEVRTDEGITGWGDCYGPTAVCKSIVDTLLKPTVIGKDPFDVEVIWETLYNKVKDYGLSGMTISGISGIDIAMWDIIGKATGMPIHKLIGGSFRPKVLAYASGLYFRNVDRLTDEAVEEARGYASQGFRAIKMKIGLGSVRRDIERVAAVRAAIGQDVQLIVDADHCYNVSQAITIGRELEKLGVYWFEEPVSPEDIDGYVEVSRALDIAVAGGENEFTKHGFRRPARAPRDGHHPAGRVRGGRHHRVQEDRRARAGATRPRACRMPGAPRSGWPRRCSSSPRFRSARRAWCRCRRCSNTSRPSTRFATTWRGSPSPTSRAGLTCRRDRDWALRWTVPFSNAIASPEGPVCANVAGARQEIALTHQFVRPSPSCLRRPLATQRGSGHAGCIL